MPKYSGGMDIIMKSFCVTSTIQERSVERELLLDDELIKKVSDGDVVAFETLYRATYAAVYGFSLSILKNQFDAQDILQDTFIKIRDNAKNYQPQGKPLAWIFTITRNLSLMKIRERGKRSHMQLEDINLASEDSTCTVEDKMVLQAAFDVLGDKERQIVMLHALTGLKHKDIAQILGMPLSTVLSKYKRSLEKLNKKMCEK
ncbi:MAG: RNA polymerase sigma factor [Oscillospiraceae bacterium]